jgi:4-amino-4-deoxy-L-arabinose transferase-like glycosyltransferase
MSNVAPPRGRAFEDGPERAVGARRDGSSRVWILAAVGLLLLALVVRVAYVLHSSNYFPRIDAASYNLLASGLAQGHGWVLGSSAYRPPGYPFFLAGVYLLFGVPHTSWTDPRLVQAVVLSTVTVGLTGLMAWQVAGRAAALISMAIAAVYIPLVLVGVSLMTESLFVPLVLGATNCALYSRRAEHSRRWVVAAGFLTGLAALTRGNGLVVGLALALVVWGAKPRLSWRAVASPALLLVVMCLTIMPWTVRNAIAQHAFIPVTTELGTTLSGEYNNLSAKHHFIWEIGGYSTYHAIKHDKSVSEATRNDRLTSAVVKYLGQHPTYLPQAVFWNTLRLWDLQGSFVWRRTARTDTDATTGFSDLGAYSFWFVGLLAIGGLFTRAARRVPRSLWAVPFLIWFSEAAITTGTPRFEAPLDPFVIMLAAFAVEALARAILPGRARSRALGATPAPA